MKNQKWQNDVWRLYFGLYLELRLLSGHSIGRLGLTKKIFAGLFTD